jgi:hypothetical protein
MSITDLDNYYLKQKEPIQSCLQGLKDLITNANSQITHERRYQIQFFCYKGKKLCFLWVQKKKPLLGFVEDSSLQKVVPGIKRKDKVLIMLQIDSEADFLVEEILERIQAGIKTINVY